MLTIVEIAAREDGGHGVQSQSHRTTCWEDGWIAVPSEFVSALWDCRGYCDLEIQDGALVGLTPKDPPPLPEPPPTEEEQLRADLDYYAVMTGVDLS